MHPQETPIDWGRTNQGGQTAAAPGFDGAALADEPLIGPSQLRAALGQPRRRNTPFMERVFTEICRREARSLEGALAPRAPAAQRSRRV